MEQPVHEDRASKAFLYLSLGFLLLGVFFGILTALKFVAPGWLSEVRYLTFGRTRPVHVNLVLFFWLLAVDVGLVFYFVPRICGVRLFSERLGVATAVLWGIIGLASVVALLAGQKQGLEYAELPGWIDHLVVIAWILYAVNVLVTIARRKQSAMYVSLWYVIGSVFWTAILYIAGNYGVRGLTGINQANVNFFYVHNVVGLIFTPLGLAVAYYFIPRAANTPLYNHRLSMIGFWTISFIYVWTGAHHVVFGPFPQWLQTLAISFSLLLVIPVVAVVTNFFGTMIPVRTLLKDNLVVRFFFAGTVAYLLTCLQGPFQALRGVNVITSKTDWVVGHAHLALYGTFTFFAMGGVYFSVEAIYKTKLRSLKAAKAQFWVALVGGLVYMVPLWIGGVAQGYQWNDPAGHPVWVDTVRSMAPYWYLRLIGGVLMGAGVVMLIYNVALTVLRRPGAREPVAVVPPEARARSFGRFEGGV